MKLSDGNRCVHIRDSSVNIQVFRGSPAYGLEEERSHAQEQHLELSQSWLQGRIASRNISIFNVLRQQNLTADNDNDNDTLR